MDLKPKENLIERNGRPHFYNGYVLGYHTPCLRYQVKFKTDKCQYLSSIDEFLKSQVEPSKDAYPSSEKSDEGRMLWKWIGPILKKAGHPVFESAHYLSLPSSSNKEALIIQPCFDPAATLLAVDFVIDLINKHNKNLPTMGITPSHWDEKFKKLIQKLSKTGLQGFNSIHFLSAAHDLGIPWMQLGGNLIQLGIGNKARWINSSLTDRTPVISTKIARNKSAAAELLKKAGLPVPPHFFAADPEAAVNHAKSLGYPVVVKPANLDGGVGVKANLNEEDAVRKAFREARKASSQILIEKHVPGRDYRLQIVNGKVQGILERIPGGVIGNGSATIIDLLIQQNNLRKSAQDDRRYLHPILKDDESSAQLSMQGLNWESIPQAGYFVRLRGAANVASGGIPVEVSIDLAHPDNLALAIRAVRILKLDIAGVDLLIPDIQNSWLESGAHICEVNAQPQMFTTMHKPMLEALFANDASRIPIIIHLSASPTDNDLSMRIHRQLNQQGLITGLVHGETLWLGQDCISHGVKSAFSGARMLTYDQAVEAIVICCKDTSLLEQGWPLDYCDLLIIESLQSASEKVKFTPSTVDWINAAAGLDIKVLMAPEHNRTEVINALKPWKKQPQTILSDFSDHKKVEHTINKLLSAINKTSNSSSKNKTYSRTKPSQAVDHSSSKI